MQRTRIPLNVTVAHLMIHMVQLQTDAPCSGNNQQMCGGAWANLVYSTSKHVLYVLTAIGHLDNSFHMEEL